MRIPKTLAGIAIIGLGGLSSMIPVAGAVIAPALIKVGEGIALWGATAKTVRVVKDKSMKNVFRHEKQLIKKKGQK